MLIAAIVLMILALTLYTIGVWGERLAKRLAPRHLAFFWAGLVCDTAGTTVMSVMSGSFAWNFHGITGLAAILLMIAHALWATLVLVRKDEKAIAAFHRFSLLVWAIWLVPFVSGMVVGAAR